MDPLLSCLIPVGAEPTHFFEVLGQLASQLDSSTQGRFEILVVANSRSGEELVRLEKICDQARVQVGIESLTFTSLPVGTIGKGRSLQRGVELARGKYILFIDADLPYKLDFVDRALGTLSTNPAVHMVSANRRLPESRFNVPVPILKIAYARHRLGVIFNRLIRLALPITVTDTQAGMKMMTATFARHAFGRMKSLGFWFDIELFLFLSGLSLEVRSIPVELKLNSEKSTIKIIRHGISALAGLCGIAYAHYVKGFYGLAEEEKTIPLKEFP